MTDTITEFQIEYELFQEPYIDIDEERTEPRAHRYVHGGFVGTDTRFSFYFPPAGAYEGRFYQHITPVPESEHLAPQLSGEEDKIGFAFSSGAFFVETNGGGAPDLSTVQLDNDPTIGAYRSHAAAALYAKTVAQSVYGPHTTYGYAFGGSGGGFRTIGAAENTRGVWDGFVPYVIGSPVAIPNVFTVRMHAMRVLRDVLDDVVDVVEPGSERTVDDVLTGEQRAAYDEATKMGFPPPSWYGHRTMGTQAFGVLYKSLGAIDPTYYDDFWTVPGYLGADPASSAHRDRVQLTSTVTRVYTRQEAAETGLLRGIVDGPSGGVDEAFKGGITGPDVVVAFRIAEAPHTNPMNSVITVRSGAAAGTEATSSGVEDDLVLVDFPDLSPGLRALRAGDEVSIDNSNLLAAQTYHRHQVPDREFTVWDQFRLADGSPKYPQRPLLLGPIMSRGASGTIQSGDIAGKMIVVESLHDREAFAWQADWYRSKVREHLGDATDDTFRVWMVDHALHGDVAYQEHPTHTVSYLGVLHTALRQVAAWAEAGVEPAPSTRYDVMDGQIVLPGAAGERGGVQPTVVLTANGAERADVAVGERVAFRAVAETPGQETRIVELHWDFDGSGRFEDRQPVTFTGSATQERTHIFSTRGTYFVTVKAVAQQGVNTESPFGRIQNLARVRVVVS